jgi:16S rRNA (guanine966-N2)-methyltransferase
VKRGRDKPGGPVRAGRVRIQAGRWKGRTLAVPASARPTSGRARAALFDLLGARLSGARVLDLYAGSGAVGLEAVSRGAARAVLVELEADTLLRQLARWTVSEEEVRVLREPAARALARLGAGRERFDVVFADPPYGNAERFPVEELAGVAGVLAEDGVVVVQTDARAAAPGLPGLAPTARREYGRNVFHFLAFFDATAGKC